MHRLREAIEQMQELGCVIKDLDTGLLDFPTLFRGKEVYLCWKLGEPSIGFWHGVDEGFRGRKPIDQDFLDHHEGDGHTPWNRRETEIKLRCATPPRARRRLLPPAFASEAAGLRENTVFDTPGRSCGKPRPCCVCGAGR